MNKNTLSVLILISGILISGGIISLAYAQTTTFNDIQYPISELGNCQNKSSCETFCDDSKNTKVCLTFAEQHNLMSSEEITAAKKFTDNGMVGPGSCKGQVACEQYCGNSTHLEECTIFAKKNGMMTEQQLQDSEKVIVAMKSGLKPPACAGPKQCNSYCSNPQHMEECMAFSLAAGIVPENQKEQMQKTLDVIKQGIKPPACQPNPPSDQLGQSVQTNQSSDGLPMCNKYCATHMEECVTFSLATGMVPEDQKEQSKKTLDAFKRGIRPPACQPNQPDQQGKQNQSSQSEQSLQACDQYCAESSHVEECAKFSVAMGNMTEQQAQSTIKNGGKGPGGCIGKDACDTFCDNSDNQEACFNFAKDNGMIPEADLQKMQEGQQKMKDSFSSIPPEVLDCISSSLGADVVEKMKTGSVIQRNAGDSINQCFQKSSVQEKRPNQNGQDQQKQNQQSQNQTGKNFQSGPSTRNEGGQQMPQQAGPGGCKGPEECKTYCESHQEECKNSQPQQNQQRQPKQQEQTQQNRPEQGGTNTGVVGPCGPGTCSGIGPDDIKGNTSGGPNQGQGFNPGSGQNSNGPGTNQPGQMQPKLPQQQPGQPNRAEQSNSNNAVGPCGTGPGTCSGIGPDDINTKNGNRGQGGSNQPNQPGQMQPQSQPQIQQQNPPSSPISFLQGMKNIVANMF